MNNTFTKNELLECTRKNQSVKQKIIIDKNRKLKLYLSDHGTGDKEEEKELKELQERIKTLCYRAAQHGFYAVIFKTHSCKQSLEVWMDKEMGVKSKFFQPMNNIGGWCGTIPDEQKNDQHWTEPYYVLWWSDVSEPKFVMGFLQMNDSNDYIWDPDNKFLQQQ